MEKDGWKEDLMDDCFHKNQPPLHYIAHCRKLQIQIALQRQGLKVTPPQVC